MKKVIIMGAGGRDFHNFNVVYRDDPETEVNRLHGGADPRHRRPRLPALARGLALPGRNPDPAGERVLSELIREFEVDEVVLSYSDLEHEA